MRAIRRAFRFLVAPGAAWAELAANGEAGRTALRHHALLLLALFLLFLGWQFAAGGLRTLVYAADATRFRPDGTWLGSQTGVTYALSAGQVALLLFTLALIGGAIMVRLSLRHAVSHGAAADRNAALRLVAFAMTPGLVGALLFPVPWVGGLLALAGYWWSVRLFRRGAPAMLPPFPEEAARFGRVVGRRAAMLGVLLPLLVLVAGAVGLLTLATPAPPAAPVIRT